MEQLLKVSSNPHIRASETTSSMMLDVIIAMLPATLFGIYNFGVRAALLIGVCILTCVLAEGVFEYFMKKPSTIRDYSAVVTGILLALNLPVELPVWMAVVGSLFAIIVVKQLFGGLGQNFMNPALGARCFLLLSFTGPMTNFACKHLDGTSGATPLAVLKYIGKPELLDMFIGTTAGTIGETSAIAIILGGVYLLARKIISYRIPFYYIGTVAVFTAIYGAVNGEELGYFVAAHIFGGGLLLGAIFMATDYVTSPITPAGQIVFGIVLGILTSVFRLFGPAAEGVSYAIIFANLLVPLIEKVTWPRAFGIKKGGKRA